MLAEEVGGDRCPAWRPADRNGDSLVAQAVEAVETLDPDDRGHLDLDAEVEVVAVAQVILHFRVRHGEAAAKRDVDLLVLCLGGDRECGESTYRQYEQSFVPHARILSALARAPAVPIR